MLQGSDGQSEPARSARRARWILPAVAALALLAAAAWWLPGRDPARPAPHNVVLISIDTCRADHLGCYGFALPTTPHIDALAREGVLFTEAHATNPMTLPAHSSMLTGMLPLQHGVHFNDDDRLGDESLTLAEALGQHGYTTAAFVAAFVLDSRFGLAQGFDTYGDHFGARDQKQGHYVQRPASAVNAEALPWLEAHAGRRFFLFLHYYDPHIPNEPPEPFATEFAADLYAGEIASVDHAIGEVIDALKRLGIYDTTLVIVTADHGESRGQHAEEGHGFFVYQSTIRIPFVARFPGGARDVQVTDAVSQVDLFPTVLGSLGIAPTPGLAGQDLSDHLLGRHALPRSGSIYCESLIPTRYGCSGLRGLVSDGWKYIESVRPELYDLQSNPEEARDLAAREPQRAAELALRLATLKRQASEGGQSAEPEPDPEARERLRSLGYTGGGASNDSLDVVPGAEDPKDFIAVFGRVRLAHAYFTEGRFEEARALSLELLAVRPELSELHALLGRIADEQGLADEAIARYTRFLAAVEPGPGSPANARAAERAEVHNDLAIVLAAQGRLDEAIEHYQKALALVPHLSQAHNNLAAALVARGDVDAAIRHYEAALDIDPDLAEAHLNLGLALKATARLDEAIAHLRRAATLKPELAPAHRALGSALASRGETRQAADELRQALKLEPQHAEAHAALGLVLAQLEEWDEARQHLRLVAAADPSFIATINDKAWTLAAHPDAARRRPREAIGLASIAAELSARAEPAIEDTLAVALAAAGRYEQATQAAEKALALAESRPDTSLTASIRVRLELFQQGRPYVDPALEHPDASAPR